MFLHSRSLRRFALCLMPFALAFVQACGDDDDDDGGLGPDDATPITSGVAVTNIAGAEDSEKLYRITVPAGMAWLIVETGGGTGDVDIAVRREAVPTPTQFDCASFESANEELCEIETPEAGTWYIILVGFEDYQGVTLTATVENEPAARRAER